MASDALRTILELLNRVGITGTALEKFGMYQVPAVNPDNPLITEAEISRKSRAAARILATDKRTQHMQKYQCSTGDEEEVEKMYKNLIRFRDEILVAVRKGPEIMKRPSPTGAGALMEGERQWTEAHPILWGYLSNRFQHHKNLICTSTFF